MRSFAWTFLLIGYVVLLSGCPSPRTTRFPTWEASHPRAERKNYELDDPFPDRTAAPDTQARPRGFDIQRTAPRRAVEGRVRGVQPVGPQGYPQPAIGAASSEYPNVVPN
jgi:hypothetical protein